MKYIFKNLTFCAVLVAAFCALGLFSGKVEALTDAPITNSAPIVASSNVNGNGAAKMQPWFAVGTGAFDGAVSYAKIYVLNNTSTTLTIEEAPCADDLGTPDVSYYVWKLNTSEGWPGATSAMNPVRRTGTQNCTLGNITVTLTADNAHSTYIGHEAYNVFMLDVEMNPIAGDNSHSFRAHVNGNNYVGVSAPIRNFGANSWFGIFQHDSVGKANWDYAVQFAPNCAQDPVDTPERVDIYDIDSGVFNQPVLQSYVRQDVKGNTFNWVDSVDGFSDPAGNPQPNGNATYAHRSATDPQARYRFVQGNHSRNDLSYISNYQNKYKLYFYDFWFDNTIQITLPYDQFNSMLPAGTCPATPIANGDLAAASCKQISGHIWLSDTDTTTQYFGRLHITSPTNPSINYFTAQFGTNFNLPRSSDGHKFNIDPYKYSPGVGPGPGIDVPLTYHDRYTIQLQVSDGAGGWRDATNPAGKKALLDMEYPCITGTIAASCQNVSGSLSFNSSNTGNSTGSIHSAQGGSPKTGRSFPAHYGYGHSGDITALLDPFKSADMGGQNLPHLGVTLNLYYLDTDGSFYQALISNGSAPVTTSLTPCLTWGSCQPNPVIFEVTSQTTRSFTMQYTNNTSAVINGYSGQMNSNGTVRINYAGNSPGTGPLTSVGPAVATGTSDLTWPNVTVSGTGAPDYGGYITMNGYYNGVAIAAATCPTTGSPPVPGISVYQVTKPYFKAFGASVSTGGVFNSPATPASATCGGSKLGGVHAFAHFKTSNNPTNPYDNNSLAAYLGGGQKYGASVEYSIQSLGLVQGTNTSGLGFYSGDNREPPNLINSLDFGDQAASWGGNLGGAHCVQNYYAAKLNGGEASFSSGQSINDMVNGTNGALSKPDRAQAFLASPAAGNATTLVGGTLPLNTRATLFVNGDVYISSDITYDTAPGGYSPSDPTTTPPYFTLIAKGNIYVAPGVRNLSGLYVAQGSNGFSTCATLTGATASNMPSGNISSSCRQKLTVNGSVVASQLKLLRIGDENNTLNRATGNDTGSSLVSGKNNNSIEEFNYTPNMLESSPYYIGTANNGFGSTEKIFSLPPVY